MGTETEPDKPVLPRTLKLPSGGMVTFRDVEDLTGRDYKALRTASETDDSNRMYEAAAAVFVQHWDIPSRPNLPLPGSDEGRNGEVTSVLHWRDLRSLERTLAPAILHMRANRSDGDPPLPATD